jgi:hypothetical protein
MKLRGLLILASAVLGLSACPTRDKYDQAPLVTITTPTTDTFTNGTIQIGVVTDPYLDLPIVLRRSDGVELMKLMPPNLSFSWNTMTVPEGSYTITAEVLLSNETLRSSPVTIVVDREPPTVELTPAPGSVDMRLRSPIRAMFSEPVVFASPAASTFSLSAGGTAVPTTVTVNPGSLSATITVPDLTSISLPAQLAVVITGTITDRAGNLLPNPPTWSWAVPAWIALPPLVSAVPPVLTLGRDDRPVVGFAVGGQMGVSAVAVSRYDGMGWSPFPTVSGFGVSAGAGISVAVDANDTIFVAWSEYGTGGRFINVRRWSGSGWDDSIPIVDGVAGIGTDAVAPNLRFDPTNHLVASWIESGDVFAARWTGSTWDQTWGSLGLSMATASDLVLDAQGNPLVAWRMQAADHGISAWSGTWTTSAVPGSPQPPTIATDSTQLPVTAIAMSQGIRVMRVANRQAVSAADTLAATNAQNPRIVIDDAGRFAVAWLRATERTLAFARWTGSTWDQRAGGFDDGSSSLQDTTSPQMAIDSTGTVWIAWWESGAANVRMVNY